MVIVKVMNIHMQECPNLVIILFHRCMRLEPYSGMPNLSQDICACLQPVAMLTNAYWLLLQSNADDASALQCGDQPGSGLVRALLSKARRRGKISPVNHCKSKSSLNKKLH
jgi:hypothetical protein